MNIIKGKISWIDITNPTEKDLKWLESYPFHPIIINELKGPSARAKVESYKGYIYLVYYFPVYDPKEKVSRRSEVDFLVTEKEIITVSYQSIEVFEDLKKSLKPKDKALESTLYLIHLLIGALIGFQQRQLNHIRDKVENVSAELFSSRESQREKELLEKISYLKRDISQYRIIVKPQHHILQSLLKVGGKIFGGDAEVYLNDLIGEHLKTIDQLEDYRQAIEDFETTNNQLINIKNIQVTKTFTILAFLTFPMMLFAALFSMNTRGTPIVNHPQAFWIIFGIMVAAISGMFAYFKKRDWI